MANRKNPTKLTEQQIFLAGALSSEPKTFAQLRDQAKKDGYLDTITKPHWKILVDLGYAEVVFDRFGNKVGLKRGPLWHEFDSIYGLELAQEGLQNLEICEELEGIAAELNLTDYFNDLRNLGPCNG